MAFDNFTSSVDFKSVIKNFDRRSQDYCIQDMKLFTCFLLPVSFYSSLIKFCSLFVSFCWLLNKKFSRIRILVHEQSISVLSKSKQKVSY